MIIADVPGYPEQPRFELPLFCIRAVKPDQPQKSLLGAVIRGLFIACHVIGKTENLVIILKYLFFVQFPAPSFCL
ncbi:hypothetical protein CLOHYLEM_04071 [[Clostridium] hylemonae DSM 15053]|uniref:Uncharacterized protein n=1 Tax=[Clostridium] hylemonae DSM 15053 TaxID=553973 RepID=C0BWA4_9FIRM|nr:hypothetical protein [[Clostridium] hylemonae]EEG75791.1 hypothetical protein CLOHYLEM_04071 [[Clostridium] hylemonae DSM 15053]